MALWMDLIAKSWPLDGLKVRTIITTLAIYF